MPRSDDLDLVIRAALARERRARPGAGAWRRLRRRLRRAPRAGRAGRPAAPPRPDLLLRADHAFRLCLAGA